MNVIKNLPLPARIGIPVMLVLLLGFLGFRLMNPAEAQVTVVDTRDIGLYKAAVKLLDREQITFEEVADPEKGSFVLTVADGDKEDAATALASSGIKDQTGYAKKISCGAAPGFTATRAANERSDNCSDAESVQSMLLTAGAIAANVKVSQEENGTLLGPDKSKNVVAQVFLPEDMKGRWNAEQAADAIALAVGTNTNRVRIKDEELQDLYAGNSRSTSDNDGASGSSSLGCSDIQGATEIETKKAAVRACYKRDIGSQLTALLGASDRFVLTVEPTIDSVARNTTIMRNSGGPVANRSSQEGGGARSVDEERPPSTREETQMDPAGDITKLGLSVVLDRSAVAADQVLAVKRVLQAYVDPSRGDPKPVVTLSKLADGTTDKEKAKQALDELAAETTAAADDASQQEADPIVETKAPKWLLALGSALMIILLAMIVVLWRRSTAVAAERTRLEDSFRHDQRLFEDFAQQNPDHLAQDLNALFGAPAGQPTRT